MNSSETQPQIQIELDEATANGNYSNLAISNYSQEEFILDFSFLQPQNQKAKVRSRVIISPRNLKKLAQLLTAQIKEYEGKFGAIKDDTGTNAIPFNLN